MKTTLTTLRKKSLWAALTILGLSSSLHAQVTYQPDATFGGGDGIVLSSIANNYQAVHYGAILNNDGTVWAAGYISGAGNSSANHYIGRYLANGSWDTGFGVNGNYGYQYTSWMTMGNIKDLYRSKNGGCFAPYSGWGGYAATSPSASTIAQYIYDFQDYTSVKSTAYVNDSVVVSLSASDINAFKSNGTVSNYGSGTTPWFQGSGWNYGGNPSMTVAGASVADFQLVAAQSNEKILLLGRAGSGSSQFLFVERFNKNSFSTLDNSFGTNGVVSLPYATYSSSNISSVYVQPDNKIVIALDYYGIIRLNADGSLDNSYVTIPGTQFVAAVTKILTDANNNTYVVTSSSTDAKVWAFASNGSPLNTFHNGTNSYYKTDADLDFYSWGVTDLDMNAAGDILIAGTILKTSTSSPEALLIKLKKGQCALNASIGAITSQSISVNYNPATYPIYITFCDYGAAQRVSGGGGPISCITDTIYSGTSTLFDDLNGHNNYSVTVTNAQGCQFYEFVQTYTTGIENVASFQLYPNPASNLLHIQGEISLSSATIFNAFGQVVLQSEITDNTLNIETLASGIYQLQVKDVQGKTATQTFVKE